MARQTMPDRQFFHVAITAGLILISFGLLCAVSLRPQLAQAQLPASPQSDSPSAEGTLVVVSVDARDKTVQFGDALDVVVVLQNQGKAPITIPPDSLMLKNDGWAAFGVSGSGLGESALTRVGFATKEAFTLQPGESVAMTGSNVEMAVRHLGPMRAAFTVETENEKLVKALSKPAAVTISYSVTPSKLIRSAWAAKTPDEQQRLQSEFREVLLLKSKDNEWRDLYYVENTLNYMGGYLLPLLETAMKDSDPVVRQVAVSSLSNAERTTATLNFFIAHFVETHEMPPWLASVAKCDEGQALRESLRLAIAELSDADARVRVAAISVLTERAAVEANARGYLENHLDAGQATDER